MSYYQVQRNYNYMHYVNTSHIGVLKGRMIVNLLVPHVSYAKCSRCIISIGFVISPALLKSKVVKLGAYAVHRGYQL